MQINVKHKYIIIRLSESLESDNTYCGIARERGTLKYLRECEFLHRFWKEISLYVISVYNYILEVEAVVQGCLLQH